MVTRVNEQTGDYTIQPQDGNRLVVINSASAATVTLPQLGDPLWADTYFEFWVSNIGSANVTVSPTSATIDGESSLTLAQYQGVMVFNDGSNWFTVRGGGS